MFQRGQLVTVMPPYDDDPLIVRLQPHGRIAEVRDDGYMVVLGAAWPPVQTVGPFRPSRLAPGWRHPVDVWWVTT